MVRSWNDIAATHPCFKRSAAHWYSRLHLPVAARCNIQCAYCIRRYDCVNESRPGVTSRLLNPDEALALVKQYAAWDHRLRVVGIAGPGDPLANQATFETLRLVHKHFSALTKCVSTNGLLLNDSLPALTQAGVEAVTVTVNAVDPEIGSQIYRYISYQGHRYQGREAAECLWESQKRGLQEAAGLGMAVKVNCVVIPGVNEHHLRTIASQVKKCGANCMNLIPLIPQADFERLVPPTPLEMKQLSRKLSGVIEQMTHCNRCRADAAGRLAVADEP